MLTRRDWLQATSSGFGQLAFTALAGGVGRSLGAAEPRLAQPAQGEANATGEGVPAPPGGPTAGSPGVMPQSTQTARPPLFVPRAKRIIFLCMEGGPSHVDTFDYKPRLQADSGRPAGPGRGRGGSKWLGSPFEFRQHGESGRWISEVWPEVARHADRLCLLHGMHTDLPNHAQAFLQMHCGLFQFPRPSLGAWVLYGLGTTNENLPGFITINPPRTNGGSANYAASFLPAIHQATRIGGSGQVSNLRNPRLDPASQRAQLDYLQQRNRGTAASLGGNPEIEGLISSFELAFRMQAELPAVLDLSGETRETLELYGADRDASDGPARRGLFGGGGTGGPSGTFARQCLLARRMVEAGVRFVEVTHGGWDHHRNLPESLRASCSAVDRPVAGLLTDLARRGLLEDTLVIWGGEFGRSPTAQGDGRDHNHKGFTLWMAGGGVRAGHAHGRTDDHGYEAVEGRVSIHDWHATLLHLLGLDHERLTHRHGGREMRLTDTHGQVISEILA